MTAIHQLVPSLRVGDAVGSHTLRVRDALRDAGLESDIYAENTHPALAGEARPVDEYVESTRRSASRPAGVIYQLAVGSNTADLFFSLPEPKVIDYHNITPPEFFTGWDDFEVMRTRVGRTQMARLARRVDLALADSAYNVTDLVDHGYECPTAVVPILLDLADFDGVPDERIVERRRRAKVSGAADLLFVGRLVPNKAQHDLLKAFALYRRIADPDSRLSLVGSEGPPSYVAALHEFACSLGVGAAVEFATGVSHEALAAYYATADVFVCLSEHEGFCIPLLEAMHHDVPVVAFAAGAVPETVGGAALLLDDKDPLVVALALERVRSSGALRDRLIAAGRARVTDFSLDRSTTRLLEAVGPLVGRIT